MAQALRPCEGMQPSRRGHSFLSTNEELLNSYAACGTSAEVIAVQTAYLEAMQADHDRTAARKGAPGCSLRHPRAGLVQTLMRVWS